jgi:hypothetical protein
MTAATALDSHSLSRANVRELLTASPAFNALPPDRQREIAKNTVEVASFLTAPHDGRVGTIDPDGRPVAVSLADAEQDPNLTRGPEDRGPLKAKPAEGVFAAQAAREGANVAGALLQAISFPAFVASLIKGVFHAIVESSIEQMEAYGRLVSDVAKSLNQFRDENTSDNQGRDHLVDSFPDLFDLGFDTADDGTRQARVKVRDGIDDRTALTRINSSLPVSGGPITSLDDDTAEERLVPAARTQLATSRQQLLATMVLMGINRIVVTDGRIQAKVLYDFSARDNFTYANSATALDYARGQNRTVTEGQFEQTAKGPDSTDERDQDGSYKNDTRGGSYYAKGQYKTTSEPVLKLVSVTNEASDASLTTRANLAGLVDINFRSDFLPLEKMADSFQIANIQRAAQPAPAAPARGSATQPSSPGSGGPAGAAPGPAAPTP